MRLLQALDIFCHNRSEKALHFLHTYGHCSTYLAFMLRLCLCLHHPFKCSLKLLRLFGVLFFEFLRGFLTERHIIRGIWGHSNALCRALRATLKAFSQAIYVSSRDFLTSVHKRKAILIVPAVARFFLASAPRPHNPLPHNDLSVYAVHYSRSVCSSRSSSNLISLQGQCSFQKSLNEKSRRGP